MKNITDRTLLKDIIAWDIPAWSKAVKYWQENVDWGNVDNCLEIGCGAGGISLWLALQGKQVVCSNIRNTEENASHLHKKYSVTDKISYQDIDAIEIPFESHFDVVVMKSVLGSVGEQQDMKIKEKVLEQIYKALKKGGYFLFAENLVATPLHTYLRNHFVPWGRTLKYFSINEIDNFLLNFATYKFELTGVIGSFGRSEFQRGILGEIDHYLLNKFTPDSWKYMAYGVAIK